MFDKSMEDMNGVKRGLVNQLKSQTEAKDSLLNNPEVDLIMKDMVQTVHDQKYKFRALR